MIRSLAKKAALAAVIIVGKKVVTKVARRVMRRPAAPTQA